MGRDVSVNRPLLAALVGLTLAACAAWQGPKPLQAWRPRAPPMTWWRWTRPPIPSSPSRRGRCSARRTGGWRCAELANLSDQDLTVQVQTFFRDAKGVPTGEDTLEAVVLPGMGSTSTRPQAWAPTPSPSRCRSRPPEGGRRLTQTPWSRPLTQDACGSGWVALR